MKSVFLSILTVCVVYINAQNNCEYTPSKKAKSLYEKGMDKKKYEKKERLLFLKEAIDTDPNYLEPRLEYATQQAINVSYSKGSMDHLETHFLKIVERCPDFHSDPYYYLGQIYLSRKNYTKSMEFLTLFIDFESDDEKKFSRKYEDQLQKAKNDLETAEFFGKTAVNPVPFNPVLLKKVSTNADEFLPLVSPDNEYLFFTRRRKKEDKVKNGIVVKDQTFTTDKEYFIERFTKSTFLNYEFNEGEQMPAPFNVTDEYNYGGASISLDNKHLFVTICKPANIKGRSFTNCDIYTSDYILSYNESTGKEEWHWSELKNMGPNINGLDSWEAQPSISSDGKTLFFASARSDSKGIDIYVSQKDNTGVWQPAINLGEPINTELDDKSPFIHSDSQTLYFASKGHLGFGGYDVFFTRFENGKWLKPKNIGFPINSQKDEHGFVISTDGNKVFFASEINKEDGKGLDIFTFELYEEARPKKVLLVKGTVMDEGGKVPKNTTVELKNSITNVISKVEVDENDGNFAAVITAEQDDAVLVNVKSEGKVFSSQLIANYKSEPVLQKINTQLENIAIGKPFKINDIFYETNSADINEKSKLILNEFAQYLIENKKLNIAIHGHTDDLGSDQTNLILSTERAYNVMEYLQKKGVDPNRLSFKGFGESKPLVPNNNEDARAKNRRTEFVITSMN